MPDQVQIGESADMQIAPVAARLPHFEFRGFLEDADVDRRGGAKRAHFEKGLGLGRQRLLSRASGGMRGIANSAMMEAMIGAGAATNKAAKCVASFVCHDRPTRRAFTRTAGHSAHATSAEDG